MAAPLALFTGSLLKAGSTSVAKGAAIGGVKAVVSQTAKGAIKNTVKKKAIGAVKNRFGSKKKKISKDKLLGKPESGLVKYSGDPQSKKGSSSIIKRPRFSLVSKKPTKSDKQTEDSKSISSPFEEILKELSDIKSSLENIQSSINSEISSISDRIKQQNILSFKQKAEDKESRLEEKKEKTDDNDEDEKEKKKPPSLFERILNFFGNILLGSLLNWGLNYLPLVEKAFGAVIDAFQNPLKRLKFAIITLTTVFPRLTSKVLSFGKKLFFGPAKFIGKLIFKSAGLVKKLFAKAGKAIFNIIKEPLKKLLGPAATNILKGLSQGIGSVAKKGVSRSATRAAAAIGGKSAAKVVSGATNAIAKTAPAVFKRLKTFSKVFKKVPIIGALIGIGIDLALGEPLDRAIVGAAGASLGAALGGLIGQGVIPIPGVGAFLGGFVGSAIGDWAAKSFYDYLKEKTNEAESEVGKETKVQSAAKGGSINKTQTTRETSVKKRKFTERKIQKIVKYDKSSPLESNLIKESQEKIFRGEKSAKRFVRISDAFRSIPLVGEVMNLGIAIGMGKKLTDSDARSSADQIANSIGLSIQNSEIKGIDPDMAGAISMGLSQWARKEIFNQLRKKQGSFEIKNNDRDSSGGDRRRGNGRGSDDGPDGKSFAVYGNNYEKALLDMISHAEGTSGQNGYKTMFGGDKFDTSNGWKHPNIGKRTSWGSITTAAGRYQFLTPTWNAAAKALGLKDFSPENQDKAALWLAKQRGVDPSKQISENDIYRLGGEWASLEGGPNMVKGGSYGNQAKYSADKALKLYDSKLKLAEQGKNVANPVATSPGIPNTQNVKGDGKGKKIYLHWTAGGHQSVVGPYHTIITGDGKIHRRVPYDRHTYHTYKRNSNAIGIAIAAMGGKNPWSTPPTDKQLNSMASEVANVANQWGWKPSDINIKNVMTHAEAGSNKDGKNMHDNYGPKIWGGTGERWDLLHLKKNDPQGSGGNILRSMISSKMGGSGNNNDISLGDTASDPSTSDSSNSPISDSEPNQESRFDPSLSFNIIGDSSNLRNTGFLPLSATSPNGSGGGTTGRKDTLFSKVLNTNITNQQSINSPSPTISRSSNVNISPSLNIKALYESPSSTIIMMPLPLQNNPQPQTQIPSRGDSMSMIPMNINFSQDFLYKQILSKALY